MVQVYVDRFEEREGIFRYMPGGETKRREVIGISEKANYNITGWF